GVTATVTATSGAIVQTSGTELYAASGATLTAAGDISVSRINTVTAALSLTTGGAVIDVLAAETPNLIGGAATIRAAASIGTPGADLNTQLAALDAVSSGAGTIVINE